LLNWAKVHQTWIIEDDYDSEFHFQHKPIAALQGMQENEHVIYMGSFSKTLFPSLRMGYLVLPPALVSPFTVAKSFVSGESPLIPQAVAADFIVEGHFVRHLRRMRTLYKQKWLHLQQLIQTHLPGVSIVAESAGMHLVIDVPGIDDVAWSVRLKTLGFGSTPLSSYYQGTTEKTGLVLGFANTTEQDRVSLVETLASWR
jgi:GntR family transcriptional regulator/MocR family aminotransferase